MASVEIRDVRKSFGVTEVLHGVSVPISDGEFVVLVGPSGCGKSTLLRMVAGLEGISSGEIRIGGRVVNNVHPKERDVAMVFQNYALYPHMTVAANMGFSLNLRKTPKAIVDERVQRPEDAFFRRYDLGKIEELLAAISDREASILRLRFGLEKGQKEPLTLKEIGERIGLTRERVRQIEAEALRRLHKIMNSDTF